MKETFRAGAILIVPASMSAACAVDHYMGAYRPYLPRLTDGVVPEGYHGVAVNTA